jgi:ATP-dependent DNA helicase RecQ
LFEKAYPEYTAVIKGLLRSYEGIFDYPCSIHEPSLAKFISAKKEKVISDLKEIKRLGIIDYSPQKEKPQVQFLQNRVNAADLTINQKNIAKRKHAFEKRLSAIIEYIGNYNICRSKMIASYFNDTNVKACGVCDNCIRAKNASISRQEFETITSRIKSTLTENPVKREQLIAHLHGFKENKITKVLNFLQAENQVAITKDGLIKIK